MAVRSTASENLRSLEINLVAYPFGEAVTHVAIKFLLTSQNPLPNEKKRGGEGGEERESGSSYILVSPR